MYKNRSISAQIEGILAKQHISRRDFAKSLGWTPTLLYKRLKNNSFTIPELEQIAEKLSLKISVRFLTPRGFDNEKAPKGYSEMVPSKTMDQIFRERDYRS